MDELEINAPQYTSPDVLAESPKACAAFKMSAQANMEKISPELKQALYPSDPIIVPENQGIHSEASAADLTSSVGDALITAKDGMPMQVSQNDSILTLGAGLVNMLGKSPEPEQPAAPTPAIELDLTPTPVPPPPGGMSV